MMYKMIWVGRQFLMSYSEVINSLLAQLQGYDDSEFGDNESSQKMDDKKDFLLRKPSFETYRPLLFLLKNPIIGSGQQTYLLIKTGGIRVPRIEKSVSHLFCISRKSLG